MEGSESEAVFDSLNLNPQLFINEVLNTVDDVVDDAFNFFYQEASAKFNSEGTERSQDLRKGVDSIHNVVQSVLDKKLAIWEKYCLRHCFSVPQGFVMPKSDEPTEESSLCEDTLVDPEIEAQLDSLRRKLIEVGKESEILNQEVQALQRRSTPNIELISEALQSYEQNSTHELFQEVVTTASELGKKMGNLKTSMTEQIKTRRIHDMTKDLSATNYSKGLSNMKFEVLQEFSNVMKSIVTTCKTKAPTLTLTPRGKYGVLGGDGSPKGVFTEIQNSPAEFLLMLSESLNSAGHVLTNKHKRAISAYCHPSCHGKASHQDSGLSGTRIIAQEAS
ncbi:protein MIS12-like protein [Senna tora]|uniref:Protein MIS12-like protein n=1 Tax=Senna tora TaxID=362788 RepID=A0A834X5C7_9FABA|nr:protein MIS12-like protein [Senna tora]